MDTSNDRTNVMDLFFNELSVSGLEEGTVAEKVLLFAQIVKEARSLGFSYVRFATDMRNIELFHGMSLERYCNLNRNKPEVQALFSVQGYPYFTDPQGEEEYIKNDYRVKLKDGSNPIVYGLAAASFYNSCGISFSMPQWTDLIYQIYKGEVSDNNYQEVLSISNLQHLDDKSFIAWADKYLPEPELIISKSIAIDKDIHLSDHHGSDVLMAFSKKIRNSPYVEEIVNSIDRVAQDKNFISSFSGVDIINIRLVKEGGYGIAVRTTARNKRQLKAIARILEEEYS